MSVTCLGMNTAFGALLVVYFSKDLLALDTMDFWVGQVCIFILATIQVILVGWAFGIDRARQEVRRGAALEVPRIIWPMIKYVSPAYLLIIFVLWCYKNFPQRVRAIRDMNPEDRGTVLLILTFLVLLLLFFGLMVNLAGKRWQALGKLPPRDDEPVPAPASANPNRRTQS